MSDILIRVPTSDERERTWPSMVRLLLAVMILAASATLLSGTVASLSSQTINPGGQFVAGQLILQQQVGNTPPCVSTGLAARCPDLFGGLFNPDKVNGSQIVFTNGGTIPADSFVVWSSACTDNRAPAEGFSGSSPICDRVQVTIHDDAHNVCYYPVKASGACRFDARGTYASFAAAHPQSRPLKLSTEGLGVGVPYTLAAVLVGGDAANSYQGRRADIQFTWQITQG